MLRVCSTTLSNAGIAWFVAVFASCNPLVLTVNLLLGILSLFLAYKAEELLETL